jgi:SulP family sulfate permease
VAATVLLFAPLAQYVPRCALAGILTVTAWRLIDRQRLLYSLRATRFDAYLTISTALVSVFLSIEFSILIGTFLSFLLYVPKAARLQATELVVGQDRVLRERQAGDPRCTSLALFNLEGELFFGAAPELETILEELEQRVNEGARVIVIRLKRVRNLDMVCLEILQRFLERLNERKVPVLFCGVREDFAGVLRNVHFHQWLPPDQLFLEESTAHSSTLRAVRRAYELLGDNRCATCPRSGEAEEPRADYYMI